jgi:hypothetical protein
MEKQMLSEKDAWAEAQAVVAARAEIRRRAAAHHMTVQEYLRHREIRRYAAELGLAYWPALAYGPRVDPRAYVIAERLLAHKAGARWGEVLPDGSTSHGGWDSWGHYGLSAGDVAHMWRAAGCRNSAKFRLQVGSGIAARKGDSLSFTAAYIKGWRWLQANRLDWRLNLSRKAVATLGRLTWYSRWAAISGLAPGQKLRPRDLNWAAVKVAQKGPRAAITNGYAPTRWGWMQLAARTGIDLAKHGLKNINPYEIPQHTLRDLLAAEVVTYATFVPAVHVAILFGRDVAAARRFVQAHGSLHNAGQFTLPARGPSGTAEWNRRGWAGLASRFPEQIRKWLGVADVIEHELGRVPNDLAEVREVAGRVPGLVDRAFGIALSKAERAAYERLWASTPKQFIGIPAPGGSGGIKMGGLRLVQLAYNDPLQPLAGRLVNCCQHLHGAAASCARQAWSEGNAAIWAAFEADRMVAQAFVWRSRAGNAIVLDSVEALARRQAIADIFLAAAKAAVGRLGVRRVYVGDNGFGVSDMLTDAKPEPAPECAFRLSYTDARSVRLVCEEEVRQPVPGKALRKAMARAIAEAQHERQALPVNELMEGSGVFCEFCEAEVHPECEICPSCGQDIAEWVDEEEETQHE